LSKKVLVFGYTQFDGYLYNTCVEVLDRLRRDLGASCLCVEAPVSLRFVRDEVPKIIEELEPEMVVGLGMAPSARRVLIEAAALNSLTFEIPDIDGYRANHEPIDGRGPLVVEAPAPLSRVVDECVKRRGLPMKLSMTVGTYLCNAMAYTIYSAGHRMGFRALFLHIPPHTDYAMRMRLPNHMPLNTIVECVECAINACTT